MFCFAMSEHFISDTTLAEMLYFIDDGASLSAIWSGGVLPHSPLSLFFKHELFKRLSYAAIFNIAPRSP